MLPMLLPSPISSSHLFLHLLSFAVDVASSCAFQDIRYGPRVPHPFLFFFFFFFHLTLCMMPAGYEQGSGRLKNVSPLLPVPAQGCTLPPLQFSLFFLHTFLLGFFYVSLFLSLPCFALCAIFSNLLRSLASSSSSPPFVV